MVLVVVLVVLVVVLVVLVVVPVVLVGRIHYSATFRVVYLAKEVYRYTVIVIVSSLSNGVIKSPMKVSLIVCFCGSRFQIHDNVFEFHGF